MPHLGSVIRKSMRPEPPPRPFARDAMPRSKQRIKPTIKLLLILRLDRPPLRACAESTSGAGFKARSGELLQDFKTENGK